MADLLVIGTGGHAKVVIAAAQSAGYAVVAAFDDRPQRVGQEVLGVPIVGNAEAALARQEAAIVAIGDNRVRKEIGESLGERLATVVHSSAIVHPSVTVGAGTVVMAGTVIQPDCVIGAHVIVNSSASVDHDCVIGEAVHIAPGATLCGGVVIGEGTLFGVGACAIPCAKIGAWAVIGAGAAVTSDIADGARALGVPAKDRPRTGEDA